MKRRSDVPPELRDTSCNRDNVSSKGSDNNEGSATTSSSSIINPASLNRVELMNASVCGGTSIAYLRL